LIEARHARRKGRLDPDALREREDEAIREVVRFQEEIGLPVVTDGEYRRGAFFSHLVKAVEGLTVREAPFTFRNDASERAIAHVPCAEGRLRRSRGITTDEFRFLASLTRRTPKVTMPAPPFVSRRLASCPWIAWDSAPSPGSRRISPAAP
jgi:5-methyltetrahydropteroyltriglutamate--homocysteine methyltransferase